MVAPLVNFTTTIDASTKVVQDRLIFQYLTYAFANLVSLAVLSAVLHSFAISALLDTNFIKGGAMDSVLATSPQSSPTITCIIGVTFVDPANTPLVKIVYHVIEHAKDATMVTTFIA